MGDVVSAADQQADYWDGVAYVQKHDACGNHSVERRARPEIEAPEDGDDEARYDVRVQRDVKRGMHGREPAAAGEAAVARKTPAQTALPRVACDHAPYACDDDEGL